jgi:hypothetical protein
MYECLSSLSWKTTIAIAMPLARGGIAAAKWLARLENFSRAKK